MSKRDKQAQDNEAAIRVSINDGGSSGLKRKREDEEGERSDFDKKNVLMKNSKLLRVL